MTKIDPTPLIAEAQARETALKVAQQKLQESRALQQAWFSVGVLVGMAVVLVVLA